MEYDEKLQSEGKLKRICIQNAVKQGREMLLDLVFPRRCPVCGEIVIPKGAFICPSCVKKLSPIHQPCLPQMRQRIRKQPHGILLRLYPSPPLL